MIAYKKIIKYVLIMAYILFVCSCITTDQRNANKNTTFSIESSNGPNLLYVYYKQDGQIILSIKDEKQLHYNATGTSIIAKKFEDSTPSDFGLLIEPFFPPGITENKENCSFSLIKKFNQSLTESKLVKNKEPIFLKTLNIITEHDNSQYLKFSDDTKIFYFNVLIDYIFNKDNHLIELLKEYYPYASYKIKVYNKNTHNNIYDNVIKFTKDSFYLSVPSKKIETILANENNVQFNICEKTVIEDCRLMTNHSTEYYNDEHAKFASNYIQQPDQQIMPIKRTYDIYFNNKLIKENAVPSSGKIELVEGDFEKFINQHKNNIADIKSFKLPTTNSCKSYKIFYEDNLTTKIKAKKCTNNEIKIKKDQIPAIISVDNNSAFYKIDNFETELKKIPLDESSCIVAIPSSIAKDFTVIFEGHNKSKINFQKIIPNFYKLKKTKGNEKIDIFLKDNNNTIKRKGSLYLDFKFKTLSDNLLKIYVPSYSITTDKMEGITYSSDDHFLLFASIEACQKNTPVLDEKEFTKDGLSKLKKRQSRTYWAKVSGTQSTDCTSSKFINKQIQFHFKSNQQLITLPESINCTSYKVYNKNDLDPSSKFCMNKTIRLDKKQPLSIIKIGENYFKIINNKLEQIPLDDQFYIVAFPDELLEQKYTIQFDDSANPEQIIPNFTKVKNNGNIKIFLLENNIKKRNGKLPSHIISKPYILKKELFSEYDPKYPVIVEKENLNYSGSDNFYIFNTGYDCQNDRNSLKIIRFTNSQIINLQFNNRTEGYWAKVKGDQTTDCTKSNLTNNKLKFKLKSNQHYKIPVGITCSSYKIYNKNQLSPSEIRCSRNFVRIKKNRSESIVCVNDNQAFYKVNGRELQEIPLTASSCIIAYPEELENEYNLQVMDGTLTRELNPIVPNFYKISNTGNIKAYLLKNYTKELFYDLPQDSSKILILRSNLFNTYEELFPIAIEKTSTVHYDARDEILLYDSESNCKNNNPKFRNLFTDGYIPKIRAGKNYWAKVSGRTQTSNCSKAVFQKNKCVFKLLKNENKDRLLVIIANSEGLKEVDKIWDVLNQTIRTAIQEKFSIDWLALNGDQKFQLILKSDNQSNNKFIKLDTKKKKNIELDNKIKSALPLNEHIRPVTYLDEALEKAYYQKFSEGIVNIIGIIYIIDKDKVTPKPAKSYRLPKNWQERLHVLTNGKCMIWRETIGASECTLFDSSIFNTTLEQAIQKFIP